MTKPKSNPHKGTGPESPAPDTLLLFLTPPRLSTRLIRLAAIGGLAFLLAWYLSYLFLPEGALRSAGDAPSTRALAIQVPVALAILLGNLLLRVKGIPLGYLAAAFGFLRYGLVAGTNSFAIPYSTRILPSFRAFSRGGIYEMIAWALLAGASYSWTLFELKKPSEGFRRVLPGPRASLPEAAAALAAVALLFAAGLLMASGALTD